VSTRFRGHARWGDRRARPACPGFGGRVAPERLAGFFQSDQVTRGGEIDRTIDGGGNGFGHADAVGGACTRWRCERERRGNGSFWAVISAGAFERGRVEDRRQGLAAENAADGQRRGLLFIGLPAALLGEGEEKRKQREHRRFALHDPRLRRTTVAAMELKR